MGHGRSAHWAGLERPISWCDTPGCWTAGARHSKLDGKTLCKACRKKLKDAMKITVATTTWERK